jgi:23S rRNA pseudouridine2457 synthase
MQRFMSLTGNRYFIINKPYDMLSQFIGGPEKAILLSALNFDFPEGIHAIGRLDKQSEGLLILTTNKKVTRLLFQDLTPHERTYLVRVKDTMGPDSLAQLRTGVTIRIKKGKWYITSPCRAEIIPKPENLFDPPYESREDIPHSWIRLTITEGKFHQIRKMVKAVGHRCQRLIRQSIGELELGDLQPGGVREIEEAHFFEELKIDPALKTKRSYLLEKK